MDNRAKAQSGSEVSELDLACATTITLTLDIDTETALPQFGPPQGFVSGKTNSRSQSKVPMTAARAG
jgi:hypothetical protein